MYVVYCTTNGERVKLQNTSWYYISSTKLPIDTCTVCTRSFKCTYEIILVLIRHRLIYNLYYKMITQQELQIGAYTYRGRASYLTRYSNWKCDLVRVVFGRITRCRVSRDYPQIRSRRRTNSDRRRMGVRGPRGRQFFVKFQTNFVVAMLYSQNKLRHVLHAIVAQMYE